MGILTTQESARGFSTYVTLFGLALLVASASYLGKLDKWTENSACAQDILRMSETGNLNEVILCSTLGTWRTAAIIGIIIGVIDFLLLPFFLCCVTCVACGCTAVFCICLDSGPKKSSNRSPNVTRATAASARNELETATAELESDVEECAEKFRKCNADLFPPAVRRALNILGWTIWVFGPFAGTAFITIWLYKTDAIRVRNDELYGSALTLFVIALLNLMVYFEKFMSSLCSYVSQLICGKPKKSTLDDVGEQIDVIRKLTSHNEV